MPEAARPDDALRQAARAALKRWFGFDSFRDGQEDVVAAMASGRDLLVVMPTGGGKSLCYQLPALLQEGVTFVVSPLIALMKDQVDALEARGLAATVINSTVPWPEQKERLDALRRGEYKLLYVSPERFRAGSFLDAIGDVRVSRLAIDEAHCLSQWGHDFRPDYLRLGEVRRRLGDPPVAAFTATATPLVREDIRTHLRLRDPFELVSGFARPNLGFNVTQVGGKADKIARLLDVVREWKTGIVYCATRRSVEEVASELRAAKIKVVEYHAGLDDAKRQRAQEMFLSRKRDVAVATNAFGMGIDRADVRFVVHYELPGSIEAYYQEAGRAGRDGQPGHCELLFNYADKRTQEFFLEGANPGETVIRQIYQMLRNKSDNHHEVHLTIEDLAEAVAVKNSMAVSSALSWLVRAKVIERFDVPGLRLRGTRLLDPDLRAMDVPIDAAALREKERRDRARLLNMIEFCYGTRCRQGAVLDYFGEKHGPLCGRCDQCRAGGATVPRDLSESEIRSVRVALSGVARASRREEGTYVPRFGRQRIIEMLVGSESEALARAGLDQLSTYGLLREMGGDEVRRLLDALESAGLLRTARDGEYPLLAITSEGEAVMKGRPVPWLDWRPGEQAPRPRRKPSTAAAKAPGPRKRKPKTDDEAPAPKRKRMLPEWLRDKLRQRNRKGE